jgi:D-aminoacyl-tRNA deacylase
MRVVAQRVSRASVEVDGELVGEIGRGLLLFVGVGRGDTEPDRLVKSDASPPGRKVAVALADKVANLRIFQDGDGKSNLSLLDTGGSALVISQFTLYADCRRGRRPSFTYAADPAPAEALVEEFRVALEKLGVTTAAGRFGAHMNVSLVNDGPYTIVLDSEVPAACRETKLRRKGAVGMRERRTQGARIAALFARLRTLYRAVQCCLGAAAWFSDRLLAGPRSGHREGD